MGCDSHHICLIALTVSVSGKGRDARKKQPDTDFVQQNTVRRSQDT